MLWCQTQLFPLLSKNSSLDEVFNPCLTFGTLPLIPLSFVVLANVTVVLSAQFFTNQSINLWSSSTRLKLIVAITSIVCSIFASSLSVALNHGLLLEEKLYGLFDVLFCLFALCTHRLSLKFGYVSSGFLHMSWFLRLISLIPVNYYLFRGAFTSINALSVALLVFGAVEFVCSLVQVIMFVYPDNSQQNSEYQRLNEQPPCPFYTSSAIQNICQVYAGDLLRKSFKEKISCSDFWRLEQCDQATSLRKLTSTYTGTNNSVWSLLWLLLRCSWLHNLKAFLSMLVTLIARYFYYLFLSSILEFCSGDFPSWLAVFPAIGLVCTDLCKNLALMQLYLHGNMTFYNIRTALTSLIFDKMLRLSPSSQTNTATGVIINYITVDVVHSRKFWSQINDFIYCPGVMIIALTLLFFHVGHNMLYGLGVLVFCQSISLMLTRLDAKFTDAQMKHKDDRLKLINDVLNGIKVLKLYGWESSLQKMIGKIRKLEVREIFKIEIISAFIEASFDMAPFLAILATFYGYVVIDGNILTPRSAFVTLFLFDLIRFSIYKIPQLLTDIVTTLISMRRVNRFLNEAEREERQILPMTKDDEFIVEISKASFSWLNLSESINLSNVNLCVRPGQLVAVMGQVASGKSTLLAGIAGELPPFVGTVQLRSSRMAYVPQQAWVQNMTLRENVLFDADFDEDLYERTLEACALRDDIQLLPGGDLTEIGEKGINLSGGQKARVSLARAVYQQSDFYILDDPLSAVDSHVGNQIFTNVIAHGGLLDGKTRIVAVNSNTFLHHFDLIVYLKGGKVTYCGPYSGLNNQSSSSLFSQVSSMQSSQTSAIDNDDEKPVEKLEQKRLVDEEYERDSLIEEESFRAGRISYGMYSVYVKEFGVILCILFMLCLFGGATSMRMLSNLYMANWSTHAVNMTKDESLKSLVVFGIYGISADMFFMVAFFLSAFGAYRASTAFHNQLISSILRAPMSFFEKTPLGRIMNRFSMDMETLDCLIQSYGYLLIILSEVVRQFMTIFAAMPVMSPVVIPLLIACVFVSRYFNAASAQFRRIASNSMSKVCSAVQDAYTGVSSIRVFNAVQRFRNEFAAKLDNTVESNAVEVIANCWVQIRMDMATNITVIIILLAAIWFANNQWITLGLLGMIVNSSVTLGGLFGETTEAYRDAETEVVCVERIKEYIMLENEPIWKSNTRAQPADSSIEFQGISLRYREQDAPVIHKVSFKVEAGQKIGIVGRTGAGKTSLTSLLFRLVEPFEGCIRIGGVDIKNLGPNLRHLLAIIPQDPVLFCGSLRSNLDPFEDFTDEQLRSALEKAHLGEFINSLVEGLDYEIADGGNNLSVGQRQLICLARALLRATQILILDEATSSVDPETDQLIQQTIRENFAKSTILTIAHRLNTVIDYDKILVMKAGEVAEFDSPKNLLSNPQSLFFSFAKMAGLLT